MKRIILYALAAMLAVSCDINSPDNVSHRTGLNLFEYSRNIFDKFVLCPTEDLAILLTLDEFMKQTPQEQAGPQWDDFRSKIEHYSDTRIRISSYGIIVDTRGVSLSTPGNNWIITVFDARKDSQNSEYDYYWFEQYATAPGHGKLKQVGCVGENEYEIIDVAGGREAMVLSLTASRSEMGGYVFSGSGSGSIGANDKGMGSRYVLAEFQYRDKQTEGMHLRVDTYLYDKAMDWCEIYWKPGDFKCDSNLEIVYHHQID